jgi:putative thioredoxin
MNPSVVDVGAADFQREVLDESFQRPVMVDFWADWCGPCKALAPILQRVVDEMAGKVRLAKVDTESEQALAAQHGIRSLPTVRLFRDGKPVAEFMGAQPEGAVREFLEKFADLGSGALAAIRELVDSGDLDQAREALAAHRAAEPDDEMARLLEVELSLAAGDPTLAREQLDGLPLALQQEEQARSLAARITFAAAATSPAPGDRATTSGAQPLEQRYQQGLQAISAGQVDEGLQALLDIVSQDRAFRDDGARKAMLEAFVMLGDDDPRVSEYRGKLFSLMH